MHTQRVFWVIMAGELPSNFHLEEADNLFQTETMSKALGAYVVLLLAVWN